MAAVTIYVGTEDATPLPGGQKIVKGGAWINVYDGGGSAFNLANYFSNSAVPTVLVSATNGYVTEYIPATASTGKVRCFFNLLNATTINGAEQNVSFYEVTNQAALSGINVPFIAIGRVP